MMELISKEVVKRIIDSGRTREQMLEMVECAATFDSSIDDCNLNYEQGNMEEQYERLNRAVKALERAMPGQEWQRGEVNLYKLGKCIKEGFRKGLKDDRK